MNKILLLATVFLSSLGLAHAQTPVMINQTPASYYVPATNTAVVYPAQPSKLNRFYVNAFVGANYLSKAKSDKGSATFKTGYANSYAIGYRFANLFGSSDAYRLELEYTLTRNGTDKTNSIFLTDANNYRSNETIVFHETSVIAHRAMANFCYDFATNSRFTPYIGLGIGHERRTIKINVLSVDDPTLLTLQKRSEKSSGNSVACQALAGVNIHLYKGLGMSIDYRYVSSSFKAVDSSQSIGASLNYSF